MKKLVYFVLIVLFFFCIEISPQVSSVNEDQQRNNDIAAVSTKRNLRRKRKAPEGVVRTGATDGGIEMIKSRETNAYSTKPAIEYYSQNEQAMIHQRTKAYDAFDVETMYRPVDEVSIKKPFIFFHQRKAGGSTLRHEFYHTAEILKLPRYIACYGHILCDNYRIPLHAPKAIYAMHIQWGEQKILEQIRFYNESNAATGAEAVVKGSRSHRHRRSKRRSNSTLARTLTAAATNRRLGADSAINEYDYRRREVDFSCMTNFREPVSRLISCAYFRFLNLSNFYRYVRKTCIGDLTNEELVRLLMERVDKYGNSCLNEPYRILSGIIDEDMLNNLGMRYDRENASISNAVNLFSAEIFNATLMRVTRCPPMILEYPESAQLIAYKFPVFFQNGAFRQKKAFMSQNYNSKCAPPSAEQMAIFEQLGAFERLLYDTVLNKTKQAFLHLSEVVQLPNVFQEGNETVNSNLTAVKEGVDPQSHDL